MSFVQDEYGKRALDFVEDMQKLKDYDSICERINMELEWFGLEFVTIADMPGPGKDVHDGLLCNTRPPEYNERYARENYINKDPVMLALRQHLTPFGWDDVRRQKMTKAASRIIDEGRDFGARDGFVVPIITASGSVSLFSPCGRTPNLSPRARSALEMIGIYSHQALQRAVIRGFRDKGPSAPLTKREREVITWVATGKSDDEIASILNVGRETVTTHVENAKHKLNATRRTYAVVQALRFGEISL